MNQVLLTISVGFYSIGVLVFGVGLLHARRAFQRVRVRDQSVHFDS